MTEAAQHEQNKYAGIYASQEPRYTRYGHSNHGKAALNLVLSWRPESLVDVGCGHNEFCHSVRAAVPGINAVGVDFACPSADVQANATALPFPGKAFDVLTAFDMLEHILPEQVDAVLSEFSRISKRFCFSIAHQPSVYKWNGENLHPTVQPEDWWVMHILHAGGRAIVKHNRYLCGEWGERFKPLGERVILVGNGPSIQCGKGAEIDTFDEVVRFNTYHLNGFTEHTGTKTTLWSTFGRGQLPACDQRPERAVHIHGEKGEVTYEVSELYRIPRWFYNRTRAEVQRRAKEAGRALDQVEKLLASSGLLVTRWLVDVVGVPQVHLIGFDHFSKDKSKQHHYWMPQAFGKPKEHDGAVEAAIFQELQQAGRVEYL